MAGEKRRIYFKRRGYFPVSLGYREKVVGKYVYYVHPEDLTLQLFLDATNDHLAFADEKKIVRVFDPEISDTPSHVVAAFVVECLEVFKHFGFSPELDDDLGISAHEIALLIK